AWGRGSEEGVSGLDTTGVYSNGDLAANKKGLQFYRELEAGPDTLVFDIARYIATDWNEENNANQYVDSVGKVVWSNLLSTGAWLPSVSASPPGTPPSPTPIGFTFTVLGNTNSSGSWKERAPAPPGTSIGSIFKGQIGYKTRSVGSYTVIE